MYPCLSICVYSSLVPKRISTNWEFRPGNFSFLGHLQRSLLNASDSDELSLVEFLLCTWHSPMCFTCINSIPPCEVATISIPISCWENEAQRVKTFFQSYIEVGFKHRSEVRIV